jgi:hypothetical protein
MMPPAAPWPKRKASATPRWTSPLTRARPTTSKPTPFEIRLRATRRLDQLRTAQKEAEGLATGGQPYQSTGLSKNPVAKPTLAQQGIDKTLPIRTPQMDKIMGIRQEMADHGEKCGAPASALFVSDDAFAAF